MRPAKVHIFQTTLKPPITLMFAPLNPSLSALRKPNEPIWDRVLSEAISSKILSEQIEHGRHFATIPPPPPALTHADASNLHKLGSIMYLASGQTPLPLVHNRTPLPPRQAAGPAPALAADGVVVALARPLPAAAAPARPLAAPAAKDVDMSDSDEVIDSGFIKIPPIFVLPSDDVESSDGEVSSDEASSDEISSDDDSDDDSSVLGSSSDDDIVVPAPVAAPVAAPPRYTPAAPARASTPAAPKRAPAVPAPAPSPVVAPTSPALAGPPAKPAAPKRRHVRKAPPAAKAALSAEIAAALAASDDSDDERPVKSASKPATPRARPAKRAADSDDERPAKSTPRTRPTKRAADSDDERPPAKIAASAAESTPKPAAEPAAKSAPKPEPAAKSTPKSVAARRAASDERPAKSASQPKRPADSDDERPPAKSAACADSDDERPAKSAARADSDDERPAKSAACADSDDDCPPAKSAAHVDSDERPAKSAAPVGSDERPAHADDGAASADGSQAENAAIAKPKRVRPPRPRHAKPKMPAVAATIMAEVLQCMYGSGYAPSADLAALLRPMAVEASRRIAARLKRVPVFIIIVEGMIAGRAHIQRVASGGLSTRSVCDVSGAKIASGEGVRLRIGNGTLCVTKAIYARLCAIDDLLHPVEALLRVYRPSENDAADDFVSAATWLIGAYTQHVHSAY